MYFKWYLSRPKLIVLLGPSHFKHFQNQCALSKFSSCNTPFGDIKIDMNIMKKLAKSESNLFTTLSSDDDLKEHSLEMHFPFIYKLFKASNFNLIPLQVGQFSDPIKRSEAAKIIVESIPNIGASDTFFIVSSDFCHYGERFHYVPKFSSSKFSLNENISIMDKKGLNALNNINPINAFTD